MKIMPKLHGRWEKKLKVEELDVEDRSGGKLWRDEWVLKREWKKWRKERGVLVSGTRGRREKDEWCRMDDCGKVWMKIKHIIMMCRSKKEMQKMKDIKE